MNFDARDSSGGDGWKRKKPEGGQEAPAERMGDDEMEDIGKRLLAFNEARIAELDGDPGARVSLRAPSETSKDPVERQLAVDVKRRSVERDLREAEQKAAEEQEYSEGRNKIDLAIQKLMIAVHVFKGAESHAGRNPDSDDAQQGYDEAADQVFDMVIGLEEHIENLTDEDVDSLSRVWGANRSRFDAQKIRLGMTDGEKMRTFLKAEALLDRKVDAYDTKKGGAETSRGRTREPRKDDARAFTRGEWQALKDEAASPDFEPQGLPEQKAAAKKSAKRKGFWAGLKDFFS